MDLSSGWHPRSKSAELIFYTKRVSEIFDVHAGFTAGQMRPLYQSMTHTHGLSELSIQPLHRHDNVDANQEDLAACALSRLGMP